MSSFFTYRTKAGQRRTLWLETVTDLLVTQDADVTEFPVEEDADLTDHIRPKRFSVSMTSLVSNQPIYTYDEISPYVPFTDRLIGAYVGSNKQIPLNVKSFDAPLQPTPGSVLSAAVKAVGALISRPKPDVWSPLVFDRTFNAVTEIGDELRLIQNGRVRGELYTFVRVHRNVVLQSFAEARSSATGSGAEFKLSFREISLATAIRTKAPKPLTPKTAPAQAKGKQGAPGSEKKPGKSLAVKGLVDVGVLSE